MWWSLHQLLKLLNEKTETKRNNINIIMYQIRKRAKGKMAAYLSVPLLVHAWDLEDKWRVIIKAVLSGSGFLLHFLLFLVVFITLYPFYLRDD